MKQILLQYAGYNIWASKKIIDVLLRLSDAQLDEHIASSCSSLRKTAYHIWSAASIWL